MALWNEVSTGFDSLDETINFGTRAFAESDDCIYEPSTLATIDPDQKVTEIPDITTCSNGAGEFFVAVNECMTAFSGDSPVNVLYTMVYDSKVTLLSQTPYGSYLFIGLQKGTLLCINSATSKKVFSLDSSELFAKKGHFINIIYHKDEIYVINSAGCICKILGMGLHGLDSISSSSSNSKNGVICEKVASECSIAPVRSVSHVLLSGDLAVLAVGNGAAVWTERLAWDELVGEDDSLSLKKVHFLSNSSIAFALNTAGELLRICPVTMVVQVVELADPLADFVAVGAAGHERLVAITQPEKGGKATLVMFSGSGFSEKFRLKIGWPAQIVSVGDEEDIVFTEMLDEGGSISGLAIKAAVQTNPTIRLDRLLTRGKFESAHQLAATFNLDQAPIHQTMAKQAVEALQPWKSSSAMSSSETRGLYEQLISVLDKISDPDFICECCLNVISSEFDVSLNILQYAQKRISAFLANNPEEEAKVANLANAICSSLLKLETMSLIEPVWNPDRWLQFNKTHPLDEVDVRLRQGEISKAVTIWKRHRSETRDIVKNEEHFAKLLDVVPTWVSLDSRMVWLKQLLPTATSWQFNGVPTLVDWILPKIKALENVSGAQWPDIGLRYVRDLQTLLLSEQGKLDDDRMDRSRRQLAVLTDALAEVSQLKKQYGIFISLNDYLEDDQEEVAYTLLGKIDEKFLLDFLDKFLLKFVTQRHLGLDCDTVLKNYVERILRRSLGWWVWDQAPWESRIMTLLPKIANCEMRLGCVLALLDEVPVPWSPAVKHVVDGAAASRHPLAAKIGEKRRQIAVNVLAKKYNIKSAIKNIDHEQLVRLIITRNLPSMAEDIESLVNSTESQTFVDLCVECVFVFLANRKYDGAETYLGKLDDKTAVNVCKVAMQSREGPLAQSNEEVVAKIGFYAVIERRLKDAQSRGVSCGAVFETSRRLRNETVLQAEFPSVGRTNAAKSRRWKKTGAKSKHQKLLDYIDDIVRNGRSDEVLSRIKNVANLLLLPQEEALTAVAEHACKSSNIQLAITATKEVIESPRLGQGAVLCLRDVASALLGSGQSNEKGETDQKAVDAAYDISRLSVLHCPDIDLPRAIDVFGWARTWHGLSDRDSDFARSGGVSQMRKYSDLYSDSVLAGFLNYSELSQCLRLCFLRFESGKVLDMSTFEPYLEKVIQRLQENQRDLAALSLITQLHCCFVKQGLETNPNMDRLVSKVASTLLSKVLGGRQLDMTLAASLLSYLGKDYALDIISKRINSSLSDQKKQIALANLGIVVSELFNDSVSVAEFRQNLVGSVWSNRLPEYNISAKELAQGDISSNILSKLVSAPNVAVDTIKSFCEDYNVDFQAALSLHLQNVLLTWDPNLEVRVQPDGKRVPAVRNTEEQLLKRCHDILQHLADVRPIRKMLRQIWLKINFYYHEIFLVVLQLLQELDSPIENHYEFLLVLRFYKNYLRRKPADFDEKDSWGGQFLSSPSLPPLAEFRLPYSRLTYAYSSNNAIFTSEITLQTYKTWLSAAPALGFDQDKMRVMAIRQSLNEEFSNQQNAGDTFCTSFKYGALYDGVKECVAGINDVVMASACLYFVTNKTPPGADQLMVAKLCLEYTEKLAESPEYAVQLEKVQTKYITLATTHVLHVCGFGEPRYLESVAYPKKLCQDLYQHPAIIEYGLGNSSSRPFVNEAVEKIGQLNNIEIQSLQYDFVRDWLMNFEECNGDSSMDEYTMTPASAHDNHKDKTDDDNLLRARYVMEDGNKEYWVNYLMRFAVSSNAEVNPAVRLRALRCMLKLAGFEAVEKLSGLAVRDLQRSLKYACELESLGFACSDKSFENYNKEELAAMLLRTLGHRPRAVNLAARLCLDYDVQQTAVWRNILKQLTHLKMFDELSEIVPSLTKLYHLWSTAEFIEAWNTLVIRPFSQASCPPTPADMAGMLNALHHLEMCPVLSCVNSREAADRTLKMKKFELAALLIPFCEKSSQPDLKKTILESTTLTCVQEELTKICSILPLNIEKAMSYLKPCIVKEEKL